MSKVLVAGVGNVFLGDDAFGVEVAARLAAEELPLGVEVGDFGIAGVHLAYQLLEGYKAAVLIDALPRGGRPGDIYVIEPQGTRRGDDNGDDGIVDSQATVDSHGMQPEAVLRMVEILGGSLPRVILVGCEPGCVEEGMGLSAPVAASVGRAAEVVKELLADLTG